MTYKENIERDYDMLSTCHKVVCKENEKLRDEIERLKHNEWLHKMEKDCNPDFVFEVPGEKKREKDAISLLTTGFMCGALVMGFISSFVLYIIGAGPV